MIDQQVIEGWQRKVVAMEPTTRAILRALSQQSEDDYFGFATLAEMTGIDDRDVREHLNILLEHGYIRPLPLGGYRVID